MGTVMADRIWRSFNRLGSTPEELAERFAARLMEHDLDGLDVRTKHRSIAAALSLVVHNADMLESIQGVLSRSRVPVIGRLPDRSSLRRVRDLLLDTIEESASEAFDDRLVDDWSQVVDAVCSAMFGDQPASARLVA